MTVMRETRHAYPSMAAPTKITYGSGASVDASPAGPVSPLAARRRWGRCPADRRLRRLHVAALVIHAGGQTTLGAALVMATLMALGGLNRSRLSLSVLDDLPQIIRLWLVGAGFLLVVSELVTGNMQLVLLLAPCRPSSLARATAYASCAAPAAEGW